MTPLARRCGLSLIALGGFSALATSAHAGGFGIREQSATYLGSAFAGSAAGGDISSMYWNPAATAMLPGCNTSSNITGIFAKGEETADGGVLTNPILNPGASTSTDVGTDAVVPASYLTCQLSDKLFIGVALNSPFGLVTKPDDTDWAGSPIAGTSKVFSINVNPNLAYKVSPTLTVGAGVQIEYFKLRLTRDSFGSPPFPLPLSGARSYEADDYGLGVTAGVLWQPSPGTTIGLGYRSAVSFDVSGDYTRGAFLGEGGAVVPPVSTNAKGDLTLPEQVTLSLRQAVGPGWTLLGTVEWQNWSRLGDVSAVSSDPGCLGGVCETLNLNYRDGWFFSLGAEYAYSPALTLRGGVAYEISPIEDSTRNILLPDSDRVWVSVGASYKVSEQMTVDFGYAHIFFDDAPFCVASPTTGSTHCDNGTLEGDKLLTGSADGSADLVSLGLRYKF